MTSVRRYAGAPGSKRDKLVAPTGESGRAQLRTWETAIRAGERPRMDAMTAMLAGMAPVMPTMPETPATAFTAVPAR